MSRWEVLEPPSGSHGMREEHIRTVQVATFGVGNPHVVALVGMPLYVLDGVVTQEQARGPDVRLDEHDLEVAPLPLEGELAHDLTRHVGIPVAHEHRRVGLGGQEDMGPGLGLVGPG